MRYGHVMLGTHSVPPDRLEAIISSLAPGGDGVAHVERNGERRAVFVPHAVPGDRARLEIDWRQRPARGRILALESPGADRVRAACPWSTRCGGCDWMHLSTDGQERAHVQHVRSALPEQWRNTAISLDGAPRALGYRTRAQLHVRVDRRGRVAVGMHEARSHEPVEVETCIVLDRALDTARATLAAIFEGSRGRGDLQLALGSERLPVLNVRWRGELHPEAFARLERAVLARAIAGARVTLEGADRPAKIGDPTPWMGGADGLPLRLAAGGFGQASEAMNSKLAAHVAALAERLGVDKGVELYAGAGNLSVILARRVRELVCVEADRDACEAARMNLSARGLRARVVEADAEHHAWSPSTSLLVLDPPRTGARAVAERLATLPVAHVIYVSCDAPTLGRDLSILQQVYALTSVQVFEMFPQTSHVEVVVALTRKRRARRSCRR
jgi:23S rRNA (uracil1939-C5)-methyltransferase